MKAMVSITFDDGYLNQYDNAFQIMQGYGFKGTLFVITERVGKPTTIISHKDKTTTKPITLEQLKLMQKAGWEIGSHTANHPPLKFWKEYDFIDVQKEIAGSRSWLQQHDFNPVSFSYPYGYWSYLIEQFVKTHFLCARTIYPGLNERVSYTMKAVSFAENTNFKYWIDKTKEMEKWLIVIFHGIEKDLKSHSGWCTTNYFEKVLTYLKDSKLPVKTIMGVLNAQKKV